MDFYLFNFILQLTMPLFFFISGYLFNEQKYKTFTAFFKKRVRTLLIPYYLILIILFIYNNFLRHIGWVQFNNHQYVKAIIYSNKIYDINYVGAIWFMGCLFLVEILYFIINNKIKNSIKKSMIIFIFAIIGFVFSKVTSLRLPFWGDIAFTAIVFYYIGHLFKHAKISSKLLSNANKFTIVFFFLNIVFTILNYQHYNGDLQNGRMDMLFLQYNNIIYFYLLLFTFI